MNTLYQSASLYVGDLHEEVTEAVLYEVFREVGPIVSIRICRDAVTKKSLGYAYVNFQNSGDAERALDALNYTVVKSRPIRIMWCQRDPSIRKSGIGNIFIKNLDKSIDNKALYDTFSAFGNILSCKVSTKIEKQVFKLENGDLETRNISKGYGFVHFETQEAAEQAITKVNGMLLNGKKVFVGHFVKRHDRLKAINSDTKYTNIFVKNLDKNVSVEELEKMFSEFGKIQHAELARDEKDSSKGFGFVNFDRHEDAKKAIEMTNGKEVNGKKLFVGRHQKRNERQAVLKEQYEQRKQEKLSKYQGVNLYVKNLDDTFDDEKLKAEFSKYGNIISAKIMMDDKDNTTKGFGFVCFSSPEEANKALNEMNNKMVGQKPLYVALAQKKELRRAHLEAHHAQRMRMQMAPPMGFPGAPVFYAPQPGVGRAGFVQMVRPRWQPPMPQPRPGAAYPGQVYPQNNRGRGGHNQRGGRGGQNQRGGANNARGYKYNQNARNTNKQEQPVMVTPAQQPLPEQQLSHPQEGALSLSALAELPPEEQKQVLGNKIYPLVNDSQPALAAKITGMLLDMEIGDLLQLIESPEALNARIKEALAVLEPQEGDN